MTKILKIGGAYFTADNRYMIAKDFRGWNIYRAFKPFSGEYQRTFRYLKDAKNYILSKYSEVRKNEKDYIL